MTPERFFLAIALFHSTSLTLAYWFARVWRDRQVFQRTTPVWCAQFAGSFFVLGATTYMLSLLAAIVPNLGYGERIHVGPISLTLLGQALFFEGPLVIGTIAWIEHRAKRHVRSVVLSVVVLIFAAVHVDAYYVEPNRIVARHYEVGPRNARDHVRILHLSDLQTPVIAEREERILRNGLSYHPDLIVLTGDYVQDSLGRPTEEVAARDLRALIRRVGFDARLGVFATEGDVGPACHDVFGGSIVQCLTDKTVLLPLPSGATLALSGLSRGRGRAREPSVLADIMKAPTADFQIVASHAPDFVDSLPRPVNLVLAGHTHGGQVVLPFFGPPKTAIRLPRRYAGGLNVFGETPIHVSRGLGMERGFTIPIRFLCPPEFSVIDIGLGAR